MAVRHCSMATRVARGTSDKRSRRSLTGSLCVWVLLWAAGRRDVFGSVASCSDSKYKRPSDALSTLGMPSKAARNTFVID